MYSVHRKIVFIGALCYYFTILSSSYPNNAMGQHYSECHHNYKPSLEVSILDIKPHKTKRKLSEALFIHKHKPKLNDKSELESIVKYIT